MVQITTPVPQLTSFLERHSKESFYYRQDWIALIARLYRYSAITCITKTEGEITGFLPLCLMESPIAGKRLVALPFSDYCPLLATDETSASNLIDQAIDLARQQNVRYLELRSGSNTILSNHPELVESDLYVRWQLPLSSDLATVWSGLHKPVQRQVKKAQRLGVQVRFACNPKDMAQYYRLHLLTRSKKYGMPAQPKRFFLELWDAFVTKSEAQLLLAEYQGTVIAGMILFLAGSTVQYAYGASDKRYLQLAPNNLLFWQAITWGCSQGYRTFDFGRTAQDNQGLMTFKRGWGAIAEPLPYYYYPQIAGLSSVSECSWNFRLMTTCWKQLPLQVAGPLGGYLYKHLG
jgi:FemAB-related protein (PEP-CTERM system-associated)